MLDDKHTTQCEEHKTVINTSTHLNTLLLLLLFDVFVAADFEDFGADVSVFELRTRAVHAEKERGTHRKR